MFHHLLLVFSHLVKQLLNGYIEETVTGQKVVKVFCHEEKAINEFTDLNNDLRGKQIKAQFISGIMGPVMGNIGQVCYGLTAMVGALFVLRGSLSVGGLTIFVNYSRQFSRPINELAMQVNTIFSALAGAERVFLVMDMEPEQEDSPEAIEMSGDIKGEVVMEHVTFGYNPDKTILKDINLYAHAGQKVAFVLPRGSHKHVRLADVCVFLVAAHAAVAAHHQEGARKRMREHVCCAPVLFNNGHFVARLQHALSEVFAHLAAAANYDIHTRPLVLYPF